MTRLRLLVGLAAALFLVLAVAPSVSAQDDDTGGIVGNLQFRDAEGDNVPVEGVFVEVEGPTPGTTSSDEEGVFALADLEPGEYRVTIDPALLPEGITLRDPERTSVTVTVDSGRESRALFVLQSGDTEESGGESRFAGRRIAQLTAEGLKLGLYLAMASIGLSLIFGTTGLTNFAHAELVTWGMLSTYFFNVYGLAGAIGFMAAWPAPFGDGVNLILAGVFGMICGGLLGYAMDRFIFRGFRRAGMGLMAQMVASIGLSIALRYLFLYNFGGSPRTFIDYSAQTAWDLGPVELTPKDVTAMILSVIILVLVGVLLQGTRTGKAMRAVADNRELAESTGIDVQRVIATVWVTGGALAAVGGVFLGLDQVKWDFGWRILLLMFASVTLGGLGTAYGALVGALVVGLAINLSTLFIDAELKNMVALLLLVGILMVRPQGILGQRERIG